MGRRENAFIALYNLLKSVPAPICHDWRFTSRQLVAWDQVPTASQPALFLHKGPEQNREERGSRLANWDWTAACVVYFRNDTFPEGTADTEINNFIDAFEVTLRPDPGEFQMLNGLVYDVYISGEIGLYDAIDDPNQGVIVFPITIVQGCPQDYGA
jgi:hypothetical protein